MKSLATDSIIGQVANQMIQHYFGSNVWNNVKDHGLKGAAFGLVGGIGYLYSQKHENELMDETPYLYCDENNIYSILDSEPEWRIILIQLATVARKLDLKTMIDINQSIIELVEIRKGRIFNRNIFEITARIFKKLSILEYHLLKKIHKEAHLHVDNIETMHIMLLSELRKKYKSEVFASNLLIIYETFCNSLESIQFKISEEVNIISHYSKKY